MRCSGARNGRKILPENVDFCCTVVATIDTCNIVHIVLVKIDAAAGVEKKHALFIRAMVIVY
jgi:hypothetical protein